MSDEAVPKPAGDRGAAPEIEPKGGRLRPTEGGGHGVEAAFGGKPDGDSLPSGVPDELIRAALESVERSEAAARPQPARSLTGRGTASVDTLEHELSDMKSQLDLSVERARDTMDRLKDSHERHLRAAADLENYKKRAQREREEAERFGIQKLLKELLPVMDNLDRALAHVGEDNPLAEGVAATRRQFEEVLARYGVKGFSAVGEPFDPQRHEAMQQVVSATATPGTVVSEMVRGYMLHDRLVRPALVTVAAAPTAGSAAGETQTSEKA